MDARGNVDNGCGRKDGNKEGRLMEVMRRKTVLLAMPLAMAGDGSASRGWGGTGNRGRGRGGRGEGHCHEQHERRAMQKQHRIDKAALGKMSSQNS